MVLKEFKSIVAFNEKKTVGEKRPRQKKKRLSWTGWDSQGNRF